MANVCETTIQFRGDEEKLQDLFNKLEAVNLGEIAQRFNISASDIPDESSPFRGDIVDVDERSYRIYQDDAWTPHIGIWRAILREHYAHSDISFVYKAEELGCDVCINSDDTGIFFRERYVCNYRIGDEWDTEYFETEAELLNWATDLLNRYAPENTIISPITNIATIESVFESIAADDDDAYLTIGHFRPE